jgi:tRNA dimethylallyltransferase
MKNKVIFIVGPTAVGKTQIAVYLAKKLNAEIISCDSMQVYRGMDILTSKPDRILRKKIPHFLLDVISPEKEYNVSKYRRDALKINRDIIRRKKLPIFVGGTGLYMSILVDGIFKMKPADKKIRCRLFAQAEKYGSTFLYSKLKKADPEAALKIHPNDTKRIVRALEVFLSTGKPISVLQKTRVGIYDKFDVRIFCLNTPKDVLARRIERRVAKMFRQGLVKEVKSLLKRKLSRTAGFAIGIRELKGHFDGLYDLNEAKRLIIRNTCLYAKRQLTWFRKDKRIRWIEIGEKESLPQAAKLILKEMQGG